MKDCLNGKKSYKNDQNLLKVALEIKVQRNVI